MTIFKLPDLGEGLPDAEISAWHVKVGDHVMLDQSLVSMETAKAVVEVPSPFTGKIKKLYGEVGDIIKTGSPLVELESDEKNDEKIKLNNDSSHNASHDAGTVAGRLEVGDTILNESATGVSISMRSKNGTSVKATPAVRALAQRLQVDLGAIHATGPNNTITTQDVEQAKKHAGGGDTAHSSGISATSSTGSTNSNRLPFSIDSYPHSQSEPLKGFRRTMAQIMQKSHQEIVPVTVYDDAILFRWKQKHDITVRLIQAIVEAVKSEPALNALLDPTTLTRYVMNEVNLGLAVDTHEGLFVPVIQNAGSKDAESLRKEVDRLKKEVSDRTIKPEELKGATITLSNFGKFAGRYANPVVVPPTVAILGVGGIREEVIAVEGEIKISPVLPLSLTFDHRAVTGGEATRFLGAVIKALEKD